MTTFKKSLFRQLFALFGVFRVFPKFALFGVFALFRTFRGFPRFSEKVAISRFPDPTPDPPISGLFHNFLTFSGTHPRFREKLAGDVVGGQIFFKVGHIDGGSVID